MFAIATSRGGYCSLLGYYHLDRFKYNQVSRKLNALVTAISAFLCKSNNNVPFVF